MGTYQPVKIDDFKESVYRSHLMRYHAARGFVENDDVVIDYGCGTGYGTKLLAQVAKKVIGLDRDEEAIQIAMKEHKCENNYFLSSNIDQMEAALDSDVSVSIEVLEHLRYPKSFASKIKQSTRKKIIITCPVVPTKHHDPTHLHDFTQQQVIDLFTEDDWATIDVFLQGVYGLFVFYNKKNYG
jgi:trans-aconitate methyltransferase